MVAKKLWWCPEFTTEDLKKFNPSIKTDLDKKIQECFWKVEKTCGQIDPDEKENKKVLSKFNDFLKPKGLKINTWGYFSGQLDSAVGLEWDDLTQKGITPIYSPDYLINTFDEEIPEYDPRIMDKIRFLDRKLKTNCENSDKMASLVTYDKRWHGGFKSLILITNEESLEELYDKIMMEPTSYSSKDVEVAIFRYKKNKEVKNNG